MYHHVAADAAAAGPYRLVGDAPVQAASGAPQVGVDDAAHQPKADPQ